MPSTPISDLPARSLKPRWAGLMLLIVASIPTLACGIDAAETPVVAAAVTIRGGGGGGVDAAEAPPARIPTTGGMAATNRIAIAECYKELISGTSSVPGDLAAGAAALGQVIVADVPPGERVHYQYLCCWFLAEAARRASGKEQAVLISRARDAQRAFIADHPGNPLAISAQALLTGPTPGAAQAPSGDPGGPSVATPLGPRP